MTERTVPQLAKWPFLLGDALMLCVAVWIILHGEQPLGLGSIVGCVAATAIGVWLVVTPFLLEYRATVRLLETDTLTSTLAQIQTLEQLGAHIARATAQWQAVQEQATKTTATAQQIAERMTAEAKDFCAFLEKANDTEKAHLGLEVEKLRRAEADWLQLTIRLLDHVYALHQAGARSGQPNLIAQLAQFQNACRDIVRRVGLVPLIANPTDPYDEKLHQLVESEATPPAGARVAETLATGYTYQGRLVRRAVVALLSDEASSQPSEPSPSETESGEVAPASRSAQASLPV
ncbi:MAG: nucleotide exchange factor GrpE [Verrucomicrobia bacterium]|nr:nucleotide exchange factor GrpE [Verrucomicrobiota bacterium]